MHKTGNSHDSSTNRAYVTLPVHKSCKTFRTQADKGQPPSSHANRDGRAPTNITAPLCLLCAGKDLLKQPL
jgi:hypothetical protein